MKPIGACIFVVCVSMIFDSLVDVSVVPYQWLGRSPSYHEVLTPVQLPRRLQNHHQHTQAATTTTPQTSLAMDQEEEKQVQSIRDQLKWHSLPDGGEIVGSINSSSSEFNATNNRPHIVWQYVYIYFFISIVRQYESGSTASERKTTRETPDRKGITFSLFSFEDLRQYFICELISLYSYIITSIFINCFCSKRPPPPFAQYPYPYQYPYPFPYQYPNPRYILPEDLQQYFGHKRKDVAASLGVSVSTFKRMCRRQGIPEWQNRMGSSGSVSRSPDQHGERNTSTACETPSHNVENEMGCQNSKPNEFQPDSFEDLSFWNTEIGSTAEILSDCDFSALEEEPSLEGLVSGSVNLTVAACSDPAPCQHPMPTIPDTMTTTIVSKPPDQHGERNPPSTCKTLSTNGQTEMENEMFGHLAEMNEFLLDFDDGPNEAGVSSEWASQLRNQWTVSTAHPNSSGLVVPHPHMASQILGENMGSLEEWGNSFASLEEPLLPSHDSGSMSTVPPCSYPVPSQPMPTISHTLGSSEDRRNSLAFLEDVFPEEHVSGSLLASMEDVSLEEHVHTMGSSDDLRNLLASAEEHSSVGHVFGFINQIVPSCFDPAPSQSMPNTLHTMPPIPHMMPPLTVRQDMTSVMPKATYNDITIKFKLPLTSGIGKLKEEVSKRLECEPDSYHVEYKDEDGTWIIINCDEDVRIFLDLFTSLGNQVIELRVRDKVPNTTKSCQCG